MEEEFKEQEEAHLPKIEKPKNETPYKPLTIGLIGAVIGGLIVASSLPLFLNLNRAPSGPAVLGNQPGRLMPSMSPGTPMGSVAEVASLLKPSIVNIRTERVVTDFFGTSRQGGVGSGVIISENGYIITNEHVVSEADEIWVTALAEDLRGKVIGTDPLVDIAVVKVDKVGLTPAKLGSVKNLFVGETVIAIGSPLGFEHSVTTGVVSALNRTISIPGPLGGDGQTYTELIQTDAAINPGNSGGALANLAGEVIGINSLLVAESYGQGLGFAISMDLAADVANQLITVGKASHPYMGIIGQDLTADMAESMSLDIREGALLADVSENGPAAKAGLKRGDVVVKMSGEPVASMDDLVTLIRAEKVGSKVEVVYFRDGKRSTAKVTLQERP